MAKDIQVGTTFKHERTCTKYQPIYYAGGSGDFNPIHIDDEVGRKAGLGGVILQGLCTFAWLAETVTEFQQDPGKIRKIRARFSRPVVIGDTLTYEAKVTGIEGGKFHAEVVAKNQKGEEVLKGAALEVSL
ncbi:MAG: MaoC family dehydratase [Myxococcaceae bacterium]